MSSQSHKSTSLRTIKFQQLCHVYKLRTFPNIKTIQKNIETTTIYYSIIQS